MTVCISSFIQHLPGVFCQHVKHPLHAPIFIEAICSSSTDNSSLLLVHPFSNPLIKLYASFNELLLLPFGLPLIRSILISMPSIPLFLIMKVYPFICGLSTKPEGVWNKEKILLLYCMMSKWYNNTSLYCRKKLLFVRGWE